MAWTRLRTSTCCLAIGMQMLLPASITAEVRYETMPCTDGSCVPNRITNGYNQTQWRRWPVPEKQLSTGPQGRGEAIPIDNSALPPADKEADSPTPSLPGMDGPVGGGGGALPPLSTPGGLAPGLPDSGLGAGPGLPPELMGPGARTPTAPGGVGAPGAGGAGGAGPMSAPRPGFPTPGGMGSGPGTGTPMPRRGAGGGFPGGPVPRDTTTPSTTPSPRPFGLDISSDPAGKYSAMPASIAETSGPQEVEGPSLISIAPRELPAKSMQGRRLKVSEPEPAPEGMPVIEYAAPKQTSYETPVSRWKSDRTAPAEVEFSGEDSMDVVSATPATSTRLSWEPVRSTVQPQTTTPSTVAFATDESAIDRLEQPFSEDAAEQRPAQKLVWTAPRASEAGVSMNVRSNANNLRDLDQLGGERSNPLRGNRSVEGRTPEAESTVRFPVRPASAYLEIPSESSNNPLRR